MLGRAFTTLFYCEIFPEKPTTWYVYQIPPFEKVACLQKRRSHLGMIERWIFCEILRHVRCPRRKLKDTNDFSFARCWCTIVNTRPREIWSCIFLLHTFIRSQDLSLTYPIQQCKTEENLVPHPTNATPKYRMYMAHPYLIFLLEVLWTFVSEK